MRRPAAAPAERGVLVVMPRDRSGALPVWRPERPIGGWSPQAAADAAHGYAALSAVDARDRRRLAQAAYRALVAELPGIKRAEIEARLRRELSRTAALELEGAEDFDTPPF